MPYRYFILTIFFICIEIGKLQAKEKENSLWDYVDQLRISQYSINNPSPVLDYQRYKFLLHTRKKEKTHETQKIKATPSQKLQNQTHNNSLNTANITSQEKEKISHKNFQTHCSLLLSSYSREKLHVDP